MYCKANRPSLESALCRKSEMEERRNERNCDLHVDVIKCALHQVLRLPNYLLSLRLFYLYNNCDIT